jgi:hypothetical protein
VADNELRLLDGFHLLTELVKHDKERVNVRSLISLLHLPEKEMDLPSHDLRMICGCGLLTYLLSSSSHPPVGKYGRVWWYMKNTVFEMVVHSKRTSEYK